MIGRRVEVIAMKKSRIAYRLCTVLVLVAAVLAGCDDDHYEIILPPLGDIEGFAYFPEYDAWGNPIYYDTGNEGIWVTLYDADDILYEFPLRDYLTDTDGYFRFSDVTPDWYFLTADTSWYDPVFDVTDFYWAETPDFEVLVGVLHIWDLFLEWDGSVPGQALAPMALTSLNESGPGEKTWNAELNTLHGARSERFRLEGRQRPIELRVKVSSEQTEPESQQD